ncbi:dCTP deaminase [Neorhizobium sp. IRAMC:178]|uniref:dCTP deaminase n=1 Tax=Neorhizobium tunisiense TaxID=3144793 RepID=UPI0031F721CA
MLSSTGLSARLNLAATADAGMLSIVPAPDLKRLSNTGAASIDLRLGRWFRTMRHARTEVLKVSGVEDEPVPTKEHFVRFGERFILHPRNFVLGITLEWLRLPSDLAGYVTGKSSLGRRGLIIETAAGIQPGFAGCLALELSNVGEVPIALLPGMEVCQIFLHEVGPDPKFAQSQFTGRRKPVLGSVRTDNILNSLSKK